MSISLYLEFEIVETERQITGWPWINRNCAEKWPIPISHYSLRDIVQEQAETTGSIGLKRNFETTSTSAVRLIKMFLFLLFFNMLWGEQLL